MAGGITTGPRDFLTGWRHANAEKGGKLKIIARKLYQFNEWAKYRVFLWLWPVIQRDIIDHPGMWANALKTGERRTRTLIGGVKL